MLDHEADPSHRNARGDNGLAVASDVSSPSVVRCLLDDKVDPFVGNYWNPSMDALTHAVMRNRHQIMRCLLDHRSLNWQYSPLVVLERKNILHFAAHHADVETLRMLTAVRWITNDVGRFINSSLRGVWTPRGIVTARRDQTIAGSALRDGRPDDDPQKVYDAFMNLVQKIVDDHYGFGQLPDGGTSTRMVLTLGEDHRVFDIVEEPSLKPVIDVSENDAMVFEDDRVEWYDALEEPSPP
ncbi:MAG: hypothetical protein Q9220_005645 [cf. Caloplaca sp. 1 TL-2023]